MTESDFREKRERLLKQIVSGDKAQAIIETVGPIIDELQKDAFEEFKNFKISNYQNIDNTALLVLLLRCKLFGEIKTHLGIAITDGVVAAGDLKRIEEQHKHG